MTSSAEPLLNRWSFLGSRLIFLAFLIPSFAFAIIGWYNDRVGLKWLWEATYNM
jgi:hypothetical protein